MQNKTLNKPHESNPFANVARCGATNRRGLPCQSPAMKNGRCRLHGGLSTGPKTKEGLARCGNWKHGDYSKQAKEARRVIRQVLRGAREKVSNI